MSEYKGLDDVISLQRGFKFLLVGNRVRADHLDLIRESFETRFQADLFQPLYL